MVFCAYVLTKLSAVAKLHGAKGGGRPSARPKTKAGARLEPLWFGRNLGTTVVHEPLVPIPILPLVSIITPTLAHKLQIPSPHLYSHISIFKIDSNPGIKHKKVLFRCPPSSRRHASRSNYVMERYYKKQCLNPSPIIAKQFVVLPVATVTVKRVFSAMKIVKTSLRNKMGDQWLSDNMVVYIERDVFAFTDNDPIMRRFHDMKLRRQQL
ncbi:hypothetical protein ACFX15_030310 [Malus domestica]|uniref:Uncharacterized protein n=1 Tax=Malus domestica TaxID=3750 RepID=A0A498K405_MALDO|nr:hypothetical protein DVH24_003018 [Malus domestica]